MDHLQKAVELIESSEEGVLMEYSTLELRQLEAQQAFTHALIALVQRADQLIERNIPVQKHTDDKVYDPSISGWRLPGRPRG